MSDFSSEDFAHTARLLRSGTDKLADATCSNNRNIILAALDMAANVDDWIIRGVKGELYPCKPDLDRVKEAMALAMARCSQYPRSPPMTNNLPICIYHGNCFDGFTAAWAVWKLLGGEADYVAANYGDAPPAVTGRDVIIVDFSYKRPVLFEMRKSARSILVLDHHKTAAADLAEGDGVMSFRAFDSNCPAEPWLRFKQVADADAASGEQTIYVLFDMDRSGAGIAWDFFHPGEARPRFLAHAEDRDLWRFNMEWTREVHAAMSAYPFTFDAWEEIYAKPHADLVKEGAAIDRKHKRDIETLLPIHKRRMTVGGVEVWVANMPMTMTSDAGHALAKGEPFGVCYWDTPEGRVFSLRSTDNGLDVSEIAKQYGGGGHRNASGFRLPHGVNP